MLVRRPHTHTEHQQTSEGLWQAKAPREGVLAVDLQEQVGTEQEREQELVTGKQRATNVLVQTVLEVVAEITQTLV